MGDALFFGVGIIIGLGIGWGIWKNGKRNRQDEITASEWKGIGAVNQKRSEEKEKSKEKILEMLKEKGEITSGDAQRALGKSDSTITEYFDELEQEGKVSQVGNRGRFVAYKLK